jgi:hypothetical protein
LAGLLAAGAILIDTPDSVSSFNSSSAILISPMLWLRRARSLAQAAGDDPLQLLGQSGSDFAERLRLLIQNCRQGGHAGRGAKGPLAAQHLVKQHAEREDIRTRIHFSTFRLLGRHVRRAAHYHALFRHGGASVVSLGHFRFIGELRNSEIEDLHQSALRYHHVGRLEIAVYYAGCMRGRQRGGDLDSVPKRLRDLRATRGQQVLKRPARHQLHGDVIQAVRLADVVDGDNVRMVQR